MAKSETDYEYVVSEDTNTIDLEGVIADFRRYARLFAAVFALVFLGIFWPAQNQPPKYGTAASIMIDSRNAAVVPGQNESTQQVDAATIDTEVEILKSIGLAERVIRELKLYQDPEFNGALAPKKGLLEKIGIAQAGKQAPIKPPASFDKLTDVERQNILNRVLGSLNVKRQGLTRVIQVGYTSSSPVKATRIADAWAQFYTIQKLEAKEQANKQATSWLDQRLKELEAETLAAEAAVVKYQIANNLMSSNGATLAEQEISSINQQLAGVKVDQAESEARLRTARSQLASGSSGDDVGEALNSTVIQNLRAQSAQASRRIAELESRYGARHPEIIKAKNEKQDLDRQIQAEIGRVVSNLEAQAQIQRQRTGSLQGSLSNAQGKLASNNRAVVGLMELQRKAEASRTIYESYLQRYQQTTAAEGLDTTEARVVANAKLPTAPSSPKLPLSLALAFAGATVAAGGSVLWRRAFDSGLTTSNDIERKLGQPHLAGIPTLQSTLDGKVLPANSDPTRYVIQNPLSVFAEGFRSLRAALIYSRTPSEVKIIAVTSALPGEGKTTTSVCLGLTMAAAGQNVLVIDCDLRRRSVNEILGRDFDKGLIEVLNKTATLEEVVVKDPDANVNYLPLAPSSMTAKDIFGTDEMSQLLDEVRQKYDVVILDTAPVLPVVDTRILARKADVVAFLVRWRKTPVKAVQKSLELLSDLNVKVSGVALTQVDIKEQARYGYGDAGYYYKSYKGYYTKG